MRVDIRQVRAFGRRKSVGTEELDSLVLHTGTAFSSASHTVFISIHVYLAIRFNNDSLACPILVPSEAGLPSLVGQRDAGRGEGVAPCRQLERPCHRVGWRRDGPRRVARQVVRQLLRRPLGGQTRHSQRRLQPFAHEGH